MGDDQLKNCKSCGPRPLAAFGTYCRKGRTIYQSRCKPCHAEWNREYYRKNNTDEVMIARRAAQHASYREQGRQIVLAHLQANPCADCGETDLMVLEFDHVRGEKVASISKMISKGIVRQIEAEIEKCEVVCANCHRRRTYNRAGSWRSQL